MTLDFCGPFDIYDGVDNAKTYHDKYNYNYKQYRSLEILCWGKYCYEEDNTRTKIECLDCIILVCSHQKIALGLVYGSYKINDSDEIGYKYRFFVYHLDSFEISRFDYNPAEIKKNDIDSIMSFYIKQLSIHELKYSHDNILKDKVFLKKLQNLNDSNIEHFAKSNEEIRIYDIKTTLKNIDFCKNINDKNSKELTFKLIHILDDDFFDNFTLAQDTFECRYLFLHNNLKELMIKDFTKDQLRLLYQKNFNRYIFECKIIDKNKLKQIDAIGFLFFCYREKIENSFESNEAILGDFHKKKHIQSFHKLLYDDLIELANVTHLDIIYVYFLLNDLIKNTEDKDILQNLMKYNFTKHNEKTITIAEKLSILLSNGQSDTVMGSEDIDKMFKLCLNEMFQYLYELCYELISFLILPGYHNNYELGCEMKIQVEKVLKDFCSSKDQENNAKDNTDSSVRDEISKNECNIHLNKFFVEEKNIKEVGCEDNDRKSSKTDVKTPESHLISDSSSWHAYGSDSDGIPDFEESSSENDSNDDMEVE